MNDPLDLPPEVTTVDLYIGDRFYQRMSRELFEEELEFARTAGPTLDAMLRQGLEYFEDEQPLAASSSVPPNRAEIEEQRVTRELVPLVRQAASAILNSPAPAVDVGRMAWVGDFETFVGLGLISGTRVEFNRRVLGDIENWKPTGFLAHAGVTESPEPLRTWGGEDLSWSTALESTWSVAGTDSALTAEQILRGVIDLKREHEETCGQWRGPILLTKSQQERFMREYALTWPDDWEEMCERGGQTGGLLGIPVHLASTVEESTPYLEGWINVVPPPAPTFDELWANIPATFDKMLAPPRPPRRVFKLTAQQINSLVATALNPDTPARTVWNLMAAPIVEVATLEESTPYTEGWISA